MGAVAAMMVPFSARILAPTIFVLFDEALRTVAQAFTYRCVSGVLSCVGRRLLVSRGFAA